MRKSLLAASVVFVLLCAGGLLAWFRSSPAAGISGPSMTLTYELTDPAVSIEEVQDIARKRLAPLRAAVSIKDPSHVTVQIAYPEGLERAREVYARALREYEATIPKVEAVRQMIHLAGDKRDKALAAVAPEGTEFHKVLRELSQASDALDAALKEVGQHIEGEAPVPVLERRYKAELAYKAAMEHLEEAVQQRASLVDVIDAADGTSDGEAQKAVADIPVRFPAEADAIRPLLAAREGWLKAGGPKHPSPEAIDELLIGGDLDFRIAVTSAEIGGTSSPSYTDAVEALRKDGPGRRIRVEEQNAVWVEIDRACRGNFPDGSELVVSGDSERRCVLCYDDSIRTLLHDDRSKKAWAVRSGAAYVDPSSGSIALPFSMDAVGAKYMGDLTGDFKDHPLVIIFAGRALSAPHIMSKFAAHGVVTMGMPTTGRPASVILKETKRLERALDGLRTLPLRRV